MTKTKTLRLGDKTKRNEGKMMDYDTKCFTGKHNFLVQSVCNSKANCFASFASTEINPLFLDINEVKQLVQFFLQIPLPVCSSHLGGCLLLHFLGMVDS